MVPIAKARALIDRGSMIGRGGRHVEGIGNGERQANSRGLLYDSLGGLTRPKDLLKHREIPSDLGEIPINNTSHSYS